MNEALRAKILSLCDKVDEVISNNDWPTDEGHEVERFDGSCGCILSDLLTEIREGVGGA